MFDDARRRTDRPLATAKSPPARLVVLAITVSVMVASPAAADDAPVETKVTASGYLETLYQLHFQNPDNRVTNLRGFDVRSRSFALSNAVLDVKGERGPIAARVAFQLGDTPTTYYGSEQAWKYLQVATLTAKLPSDTVIDAGLFPSPIGPEVIPIKDNMNWSRSNLFFGLPFYHTGITASHPLGGDWTGKLHVYNGWNSVVDNNGYPSVAASASYAKDTTSAQLLYFGGIERPTGAPEGKAWRHLFDALAQVAVTDELTLLGHADAGVEPNDIGTSWWVATALYAKVALSDTVYSAVRGDLFYEKVANEGATTAAPIFWPTKWVSSGTLTFAFQPVDNLSARVEYRHDHAQSDVFFGGNVGVDSMSMAFIPNRRSQDTVTVGVTAWF